MNNKKVNFKIVLFVFFFLILLVIIVDIFANILKIRPTETAYGWKNSHSTYESIQKTITTNEFGTRDTKKIKSKKNIILLGDSNIETSHDSEKMPAIILENYLEDEYNVYSLGSWGWGNDQQLLLLREVIEKIDPEFVILWASYNDFSDNYHNIGFRGEKPTFRISDDFEIREPFFPKVRKLLASSWFYRVMVRIKLKYNLKKLTLENQIISSNESCPEREFNDLVLSDKFFDFDFKYKAYLGEGIKNHRLEGLEDGSSKVSKEQYIKGFSYNITLNRNSNSIDRYYFFRENMNILEKKKQFLTKYLVEEIQKVSNDHKAKFILFTINNYNETFKTDNIYTICRKGKKINYSNLFREKYINDTYKNIKYKTKLKIPRGAIYYDSFDGHPNYEYNKKAVELIYKKIKEIKE